MTLKMAATDGFAGASSVLLERAELGQDSNERYGCAATISATARPCASAWDPDPTTSRARTGVKHARSL